MPSVGLVYTWEPDPFVLAESIFEVSEAMADFSRPLLFSAERTKAAIRERFETETDPDGIPWPQWSEKYAPVAEARPNIGILRRPEATLAAAAEGAVVVDGNTVFFNADELPDYGEYHQSGLPDRRTKGGQENPLPRRAFLGLDDETEAKIVAAFAEWFDGNIMLFPTSTGRLGMKHQMRSPTSQGRFVPRSTPLPRF